MFYYKISIDVRGDELLKLQSTGEKVREINRKVKRNSSLFTSKHPDTFFAVSEISEYSLLIAAISKKDPLTEKHAAEFIEALDICESFEITMEETTLNDVSNMLEEAICDKRVGEIMKPLGLLPFFRRSYGDTLDFEENILDLDLDESVCEEDFISASEKYMSVSALKNEIKRIFAYKAPDGVQGHPVHYIIESDSAMT